MEIIQLDARPRDLSASVNYLRKHQKVVPAIYYGKGEDNMALELDYQIFRKVYLKAGTTQLIDLKLGDKQAKKVLIHEIQFHPLTGAIQHVDFLHVNLKEEVSTEVPVEIVGVAPAVKDLGGVLNTVKHELKVRCLPMDIPSAIEVDVSALAEFSSSIHVKDLTPPKGVKILDDLEDVIIIVNAPRVEVEPEAVAAPTTEAAAGATPAEGGDAAAKTEDKK